MSVVYNGLLDRHPDLKIMFTQGGSNHFGIGRFNHRDKQRTRGRWQAPLQTTCLEYISTVSSMMRTCWRGFYVGRFGQDHGGSRVPSDRRYPWRSNAVDQRFPASVLVRLRPYPVAASKSSVGQGVSSIFSCTSITESLDVGGRLLRSGPGIYLGADITRWRRTWSAETPVPKLATRLTRAKRSASRNSSRRRGR